MADPFVALSRLLFDQTLKLDPGRSGSPDPDWPAGTRLEAQVRAVAADTSRALLQVGGQLVDARLPVLPRVGERLTLRVLEPLPGLVFALEDVAEGASVRDNTRVELSAAGRLLGDVLGRRPPGASDAPLRLTQAAPLPPPAAGQPHAEDLAAHLRQSVERSGLFYEKHQARWVAGDYPLAELRQEPQAARQRTQGTSPAPQPAGREAAVARPEMASEPAPADSPQSSPRATLDARTVAGDAPLRGQLELLDGRALTVALPAWEGRDFHWQLPEREDLPGGAEPPVWSTRLAVELPNLGAVQAHLRLTAQGLALAVSTDSEVSRQRLAQAQAALQQSLRDAGLNLIQLTLGAGHG